VLGPSLASFAQVVYKARLACDGTPMTAATHIKRLCGDLQPRVGIILGTGMADFAEQVEAPISLPYTALDDFPLPAVSGHAGQLVLGRLGQNTVAICQGRSHYYERGDATAMKPVINTLQAIGCETLLITNAAGSLHHSAPPGSVVMTSDHLNFTGMSPLFGDSGNQRFVDMVGAYDTDLRQQLQAMADAREIPLSEGVYMWFSGPQFETPAEIRMAGILGADTVGMSTVPEVILARALGMRVAALSVITNMAAGLSETTLSHEQTLANAHQGAAHVSTLLTTLLQDVTL